MRTLISNNQILGRWFFPGFVVMTFRRVERISSSATFLSLAVFSMASIGLEAGETPISVDADFPGGSIEVKAIDQTTHTLHLMPASHPQRGWPAWWYARLDGLPVGKKITFSISANPVAYMPSRVLAADWSQPECAVISQDNQTWLRTPGGKQDKLVRTYTFTATAARMWIAWGPPFVPSHAEELIDGLIAKIPGSEKFTVARTAGGRDVHGLKLGSGAASIWIQARQHAWEAGSSWTAKGFIDWVSGNAPEAIDLRKRATIYFVPIVDVDNVTLGAGGKEAVPQDHNRDWTDAPHHPEVAAIQMRLRELDQAGSLRLFIDLHNPGCRDHQPYFYGLFPEQLDTPERRDAHTRWIQHAKNHIAGPMVLEPKYRVADYQKKAGEHLRTSRTWIWANTHPRVVPVTLEIPWNTPDSTVEGYEKVGAQLASAVASFLADPATP